MFEIEERPKTYVQWLLGNSCNYKCSYCHEMFWKNDVPFPSQELITEVCLDLIYHFDDLGRDVVFEFIGGEPTLMGDLTTLGGRLDNHPVNFTLKTNGSAALDWWTSNKRYLTNVIISVHREFCDISHLDKVIEILKNEEGYPINIQILIPATHRDESWSWAIKTRKHFQNKFGLGNLQMLYSDFAMGSKMYYPYSVKQWDQFKSLENKLQDAPVKAETPSNVPFSEQGTIPAKVKNIAPLYRPVDNYKGLTCYAGIETLIIDNDGRAWRGWCRQGGPIGSIYELPISWPKDPIICGADKCSNGFDKQSKKE
jgi:hypothetical protein